MKFGISSKLGYITAVLGVCSFFGTPPQKADFYSLRSSFFSKITSLQIPVLRLGYQDNPVLIPNLPGPERQFLFFQDIKKQLTTIDKFLLAPNARTDYEDNGLSKRH
jgi:hypothetical protein